MKRLLQWLAPFAVGLALLAGCVTPMPPTTPTAALPSKPASVTLTVSAAANLTAALAEIGRLYKAQTGNDILFNFGSSGQLAQQIEQGAPVDLFLAANVGFIEEIAQKGLVAPGSMMKYARGQIVLWTRADSPLKLERIEDLTRSEIERVAIAHPDRAPYGFAAREALMAAGVWATIQPKIIIAENIQQAHQYAETGNVDAVIGALALSVPAAAGDKPGRYVIVPQTLYTPLDQALAVIKGTPNEATAREFAAFIGGPVGRSVLEKYGFSVPDSAK